MGNAQSDDVFQPRGGADGNYGLEPNREQTSHGVTTNTGDPELNVGFVRHPFYRYEDHANVTKMPG